MKLQWKHAASGLLAAALALVIGAGGASWLLGSQLYQQSRIISALLKQDAFEVSSIMENRRNVELLLKFAGAAAAAYIDFELIPLREGATFAAVFESTNAGVEIDGFSYRGTTLMITGRADSGRDLADFEASLRETGYFGSVTKEERPDPADDASFRLACATS